MIWFLRNLSLHLWITTLLSIPLSFYVLPGLIMLFPGINPIATGFVTLIGMGSVMVFLMDYTAKKNIMGHIKEGQVWERSGISNKAEKSYIKALRLYDTFLLWPFSAKKTARKVSCAIAKFKLNTSIENQNFKLVTAVYLKMNPEDEDIAQLWLAQLRKSTIVTLLEQDVLSELVERHYASKRLSVLMVDIFIGLERKDFMAKKLYQQVLKNPLLEKRYLKRIEAIIGKPDEVLQNEAFFFQRERKFIKKIEIEKTIQAVAAMGVIYLKRSLALMGSVLSFLVLSLSKGFAYVKEHEKIQFFLKAGSLLIVSVWLCFFMINTLSHMFKSRSIEKEKIKIQMQVPKPFTIQVSAYLKQEHAHRYVEVLSKKGIDAMVKKVDGGGKTWYVVRVSEFPDKKSAAAYGQQLKQQKIIDDFFVNNK
jgi:SPOR domain